MCQAIFICFLNVVHCQGVILIHFIFQKAFWPPELFVTTAQKGGGGGNKTLTRQNVRKGNIITGKSRSCIRDAWCQRDPPENQYHRHEKFKLTTLPSTLWLGSRHLPCTASHTNPTISLLYAVWTPGSLPQSMTHKPWMILIKVSRASDEKSNGICWSVRNPSNAFQGLAQTGNFFLENWELVCLNFSRNKKDFVTCENWGNWCDWLRNEKMLYHFFLN